MKTYEQLTEFQKAKARDKALVALLEAIVEGAVRFNDELNDDDLQSRIDAAFAKAEDMRTPWFASEYVLETCREELEGMALCDAEDSIYPLRGERCVPGVAEEEETP